MFQRRLLPGTWIATLFALANGNAQQRPPDATALLARLEAGRGEAEARAKVRALALTAELTLTGMAESSRVDEIYVGADRAKLTTSFPGMGSATQGMTPEFAWSTDPALGVTIERGKGGANVRRMFRIQAGARWDEIYQSAVGVGVESIDERPHLKIRMVAGEDDHDIWFVDTETATLSRADLSLPNPTGGKLEMSFRYKDWKAVAGCTFPHQRIQKVGDLELVYRFVKVEVNPEDAAQRVAPPEDVLAVFHDPDRGQKPPTPAVGEFQIETREAQYVLCIRMETPAAEVSRSLAVILPEVMGFIAKHGIAMAGPPYSRYHEIGDETIDIEAGIPIRENCETTEGRVKCVQLPAGETAVTWHQGPYHDLPRTYDRLEAWIEDEGYESAGAFWEVYWTDPGIEPDPTQWKTQVLWPIREPDGLPISDPDGAPR